MAGETCVNGHDGPRRANRNCIQCEKERYAKDPRHRENVKRATQKRRDTRNANPEKAEANREYMRNYVKENREELNEKEQVRQASGGGLRRRLLRKGLSLALTDHVQAHHGRCDLCDGKPDGKWKTLAIDHDHATGEFRGMLCDKCNRGIGFFRDDPDLLAKAIEYLKNEVHHGR